MIRDDLSVCIGDIRVSFYTGGHRRRLMDTISHRLIYSVFLID